MNKLILIFLSVLLPSIALAHEGHHLEGLMSQTLHSFSFLELSLALVSVTIWAFTHRKDEITRKAGVIVAVSLAVLGTVV